MPACKVMSRKRICWADAATLQRRAISRSEPTKPHCGERTHPHVKATILSLHSAQPPTFARPGRVGDPSPHDPTAPTHARELPDARYCLLDSTAGTAP